MYNNNSNNSNTSSSKNNRNSNRNNQPGNTNNINILTSGAVGSGGIGYHHQQQQQQMSNNQDHFYHNHISNPDNHNQHQHTTPNRSDGITPAHPISQPSASKITPKGQLANLLRERGDFPGFGLDIGRSTSAPPSQLVGAANLMGDHSSSEDLGVLATPDYAAYYYNNSRLDPRLPPPIFAPGQSWHVWANGPTTGLGTSIIGQSNSASSNNTGAPQADWKHGSNTSTNRRSDHQQYYEEAYSEQESAFPSYGNASVKHKNSPDSPSRRRLVDMIQQDFPRTPSPVFAMQQTTLRQDVSLKSGILSVAVANAVLMDSNNAGRYGDEIRRDTMKTPPPLGGSSIMAPPPRSSSTPPLANVNLSRRYGSHDRDDVASHMAGLSINERTGRPSRLSAPQQPAAFPEMYDDYETFDEPPQSTYAFQERSAPAGMWMGYGKPNEMAEFAYSNQQQMSQRSYLPPFPPMYSSGAAGMRPDMGNEQQHLQHIYSQSVNRSKPAANFSQSSFGSTKGGNGGGRGSSAENRRFSNETQSVTGPRSAILEEFRNSKSRKYDLADIVGYVMEFSTDQHGSRFIQQKLETATDDDKSLIFVEILPNALSLMVDVFGNYVIQKFFEFGLDNQRVAIVRQMSGHVYELSTQMYGCRVVQKAIEHVPREGQLAIVRELDGRILDCIKDQNGNHVIQKAIESLNIQDVRFIIEAFKGQVYDLATHLYGCRVMQRIFEHYPNSETEILLQELRQCAAALVQDQYGNYVIQHILEKGSPSDKSLVMDLVRGQVLQLSKHKFASNVVEKCIQYAFPDDRQVLIEEVIATKPDGTIPLLQMMKDQFANYVVQKMLDVASREQRQLLVEKIRPHFQSLKKFTYGKHIISKIEKITGSQ